MAKRILIADDHEMVRAGLKSILQQQHDVEVVADVGDGRTAVRLTAELLPDLVIMDINMPELNGIEAIRQIVGGESGAKVIALSVHADRQFIAAALDAGAKGYLLKNSASVELQLAIRAVLQGEMFLSPRIAHIVVDRFVRGNKSGEPNGGELTPKQREVLQLLAEGKSNKEIALRMEISSKTVETHRAQIMEKLKIHNLAGLTKYAIREGLTSLEQ